MVYIIGFYSYSQYKTKNKHKKRYIINCHLGGKLLCQYIICDISNNKYVDIICLDIYEYMF